MPYTDLSYLREISGDAESIIRRAVGKFLETMPPGIADMQKALLAKNYTEVGLLAHKLKSSAAFMGATDLHFQLNHVERIAKDNTGNLAELPTLLDNIAKLSELVCAELRD